jgi:regulatory protein
MKQLTETEMLQRASAYCSVAERCKQDVKKKIAAAGFPQEAVARILDYLVKEKFIDEARFCQSFVNDKLLFNKWGRIRIEYELKMRNIPKDLISGVLNEIDETLYLDILRTMLNDKKRTIKANNSREAFHKLFRFAAGRGFENELVMKCLRESCDNEEMDQ